ncbi:phospholipase [Nibribacter ruber]|uniref:Phospholipase n=1 Tax=Nibribacter ruber TaxID=2698458 RepID=A0A6P1NYX1_9BACT|nr:phospholipase [Nibribacter ruber]QHL87275.1 phospholipase [Nibribacter ruber]
MAAQHRTLTVPRTAHLHQLGTLSETTRQVWVVCHGYGQLAKYFIRHFQGLEDEQTVILAPEGLSKFYLEGFSGRVGATWMTKEERLLEIEDYVQYLNLVWQLVSTEAPHAQLTLLGFSQGAATVCRWLAASPVACAQLIIWAGAFPEDIDYSGLTAKLATSPVYLVHGLQDSLITEERLQAQLAMLNAQHIHPVLVPFTGKHELNKEVLAQLKAGLL